MRRFLLASMLCVSLAACQGPQPTAQFWRPISEPNVLLTSDKLQDKLHFDLSQCHCGIYPANASHNEIVQFQPDRERLAQTSMTMAPADFGDCVQQPSLVVAECMRERGWEPTSCSGRMPLPGGGAVCAPYVPAQ